MKRQLDEMQAFRAQELLMQRATEGLSDAEAAELAGLGADDDVSFDLAAAAIDIATIRVEDMPAGVADKILLSAGVRPSGLTIPTTLPGVQMPSVRPTSIPQPVPASLTGLIPAQTGEAEHVTPIIPIGARPNKPSRGPMYIAWAAAAAGIVLAAGAVLWASNKPPEVITQNIEVPVYRDVAKLPPSLARKELLANAADVKTLAWSATTDPFATGAAGDVVWSPSKQEGYMRFTGLASNDPAKLQSLLGQIPLARLGRPNDVAGLAVEAVAEDEMVIERIAHAQRQYLRRIDFLDP